MGRLFFAFRVALILLPFASDGPLPIAAQAGTPRAAVRPTQPTQPATGPGGAVVAYDEVVATEYGDEAGGYWLFEPAAPHAGGSAAPAPLPIVLFRSGCCESPHLNDVTLDAAANRAWIDH